MQGTCTIYSGNAGKSELEKINTTAFALIRAKVNRLAEQYPRLGLSFGHVGKIEAWGDDREWQVFTRLRDAAGNPIVFRGSSSDRISEFSEKVSRDLEEWVQALDEDFDRHC